MNIADTYKNINIEDIKDLYSKKEYTQHSPTDEKKAGMFTLSK